MIKRAKSDSRYYPDLLVLAERCVVNVQEREAGRGRQKEQGERAENIHNKLTSTGKCGGCTRLAAMQ